MKHHPEQRDDEIYMGNADDAEFKMLGWETKRAGEAAYNTEGTLLTAARCSSCRLRPWFIKCAEVEAAIRRHKEGRAPWDHDTMPMYRALLAHGHAMVNRVMSGNHRPNDPLGTWSSWHINEPCEECRGVHDGTAHFSVEKSVVVNRAYERVSPPQMSIPDVAIDGAVTLVTIGFCVDCGSPLFTSNVRGLTLPVSDVRCYSCMWGKS